MPPAPKKKKKIEIEIWCKYATERGGPMFFRCIFFPAAVFHRLLGKFLVAVSGLKGPVRAYAIFSPVTWPLNSKRPDAEERWSAYAGRV